MDYWIITDPHLGHEKMHDYCGRPKGFEEKIQENMIQLHEDGHLKDDDIVICLGDVSVGNHAFWHTVWTRHPWKNWLIRGNHDRKTNSWYHLHGWDMVCNRMEFRMFGHRIILSHKPVKPEGDYINVHGHHHNTNRHPEDETDHRHRLVFIEHHYMPVKLRSIIEGKKMPS